VPNDHQIRSGISHEGKNLRRWHSKNAKDTGFKLLSAQRAPARGPGGGGQPQQVSSSAQQKREERSKEEREGERARARSPTQRRAKRKAVRAREAPGSTGRECAGEAQGDAVRSPGIVPGGAASRRLGSIEQDPAHSASPKERSQKELSM
jgi:hypothetical protein